MDESRAVPVINSTHLVAVCVVLLTTVVLLRSGLPYIVRWTLHRDLRIDHFGLKSAHGVKWNPPASKRGERSTDPKSIQNDGLSFGISRVYITFGRGKWKHQDKHIQPTNSWCTIHLQGISASVPRPKYDEAALKKKLEKARAEAEREEKSEREAREQQERRLFALVHGSSGLANPLSPSPLQGEGPSEPQRRNGGPDPPDQLKKQEASLFDMFRPVVDSARPLWRFASQQAYPTARTITVQSIKAAVFVLTSCLPALASVIEMQVHDFQVYLEEAESIVLVEAARLELSMELVASSELRDDVTTEHHRKSRLPLPKQLIELCAALQHRFAPSARDSATKLTSGLPAGRCSARLKLFNVRVKESSPSTKERDALVVLPDTTQLHVGLLLGPSLRLRGQEGVEMHLKSSKIELNLDSLYEVARIVEKRKSMRVGPHPTVDGVTESNRSGLSKHVVQQRKQPAAHALTALRATSVTIPSIIMYSKTRPSSTILARNSDDPRRNSLPDHLRLDASIHNIRFTACNSSPAEEPHRRWLGACGVTNHQILSQGKKNRSSVKARLVEHRRAFKLDFSIDSVALSCQLNSQSQRSQLLHLDHFKIHARTTWTPFGILASAHQVLDHSMPKYFAGDANEEVVMADVTLKRVRGDVKLDCVSSLLCTAELWAEHRAELRKELRLDSPPEKNPLQLLDHVPKVAVGINFDDIAYRLDAKTTAKSDSRQPKSSLILKIPSISFICHGSYQESCIRRTDAERRAAWKAFRNDELEWSLSQDYKSEGPGLSSPKTPSDKFSAFMGRVRSPFLPNENTGREDAQHQRDSMSGSTPRASPRSDNQSLPVPAGLTIEEAVRQMKALQREQAEDESGQELSIPSTYGTSGITRIVKIPPRLIRRASAATKEDNGIKFVFELHLSTPGIETFFVLSDLDAEMCSTASQLPPDPEHRAFGEQKLTRRPLLSLTNLEASATGFVPGLQDVISDRVTLRLHQHQTSVRGVLEEIDLEFWHPQAVAFVNNVTGRTLRSIQKPSRHFNKRHNADHSHGSGRDARQIDRDKEVDAIDSISAGLDVWLSVGGLVAHVGGNDPQCDPHLTRGIGFEARRIAAELCCQTHGAVVAHVINSDWGHRSSLQLPEDIKVSTVALATRHGKAAVAKLSLYEIGLFPVLDMERATQSDAGGTSVGRPVGPPADARNDKKDPVKSAESAQHSEYSAKAIFADAIWAFQDRQPAFTSHAKRQYNDKDRAHNFMFWMPYSSTKAVVRPRGAQSAKVGQTVEEISVISEGTRLLSFKIQLLHTYCLLIAASTIREVLSRGLREKGNITVKKAPADTPSSQSEKAKSSTVFVQLEVSDVHVFIDLPENVRLFLHLRRLSLKKSSQEGFSCSWESLMGAVESPRTLSKNLWEEAVRLRDWTVTLCPRSGPGEKPKVAINGDAGSVRIPFGYVVHRIIDAASVSFKATKQLVHQFIKGSTDSIITPVGEDPKHLPYIDFHVRVLTLEAQDDPFETRLNLIWRTGGDENRARLDREEAFEAKVMSLKAEYAEQNRQASRSTISLSSSQNQSIYESSEDEYDDASTRSSRNADGVLPKFQATAPSLDEQIQDARDRLNTYNSSSWIRRYANAKAEQGRREDAALRRTFGRYPTLRQAVELPIEMAQPNRAAPLARFSLTEFRLQVGPPSFDLETLRDWMHEQGQGTPRDLPYSLLVPLYLQLTLAEARMELRDYPLPLLHIPPLRKDQSGDSPAFKLSGDICLAEHLSEGQQSIRHVPTIVIPAAVGRSDSSQYGINVPKVTMPVKLYGSPQLDFNSLYPTRFCWGQSLQPAISDLVRVFDGITSPPPDPSPKIGFWDKLPLVLHGRYLFRWDTGGELHFYLKGSRDPYSVVGNGAGWVMCWRKKVQVRIGFENDDNEFLQFLSNEYILAIPDLRDLQDTAATGTTDDDDSSAKPNDKGSKDKTKGSRQSSKDGPHKSSRRSFASNSHSDSPADGSPSIRGAQFSKICLRLTQGVRWGASLRHEHTCRDGECPRQSVCRGELFNRECRFFDRRPHWTVIQRSREYMASLPKSKQTDSFYRWRSDFSHLGLSITSPQGGLSAYGETWKETGGANNLYFSPLAWQHFWAWMRLFDSAMGLPIRQGKLFPNSPPPSPKFGRQLGTIKYRFDIAPLFISHLYQQYSRSDWANGVSTMLGLKARLGVFHVDMHQRQQEMVKERPEMQEAKKGYHKPFYEAEADFSDIDLRTLVGRFADQAKELVPYDQIDADDDLESFFYVPAVSSDGHSSHRSTDVDKGWYDVNDFIEVDTLLPGESDPKIRLIPTMTCPHYNFYRRYDSRREHKAKAKESTTLEESDADQLERTKFGNECPQTHTCLIGKAPTAHHIQSTLAQERLDELRKEAAQLKTSRGNAEERSDVMKDLQMRIRLIEQYLKKLHLIRDPQQDPARPQGDSEQRTEGYNGDRDRTSSAPHVKRDQGHTYPMKEEGDGIIDIPEVYRDWDTFDDRFFIHNPTLFFTNETRHILLRYYASSKRRKGFIHNMTSRAILNIRKLAEHRNEDGEERKQGHQQAQSSEGKAGSELLIGLLNDTMQYMVTDAGGEKEEAAGSHALLDTQIDPYEGISDAYSVRRANVCILLKPQIVMKSNIDDASTVVMTAIRTRLQNYSILDPSVADEDSVNRRILTRNYFSLDGLQAFHPNPKVSSLKPASALGGLIQVPLETLVDVRYETKDFDRVVSRTDASLRYDKFNRLRLHDSTRPLAADTERSDPAVDHLRHHMDLLRVRCPRFAVSANSTHFGAMYNIVTDLILYRAPSWREHSKQLEAMLLSYDFTNSDLLADVVADLQVRIRRAVELDAQYQLHFDELNESGRLDLFDLKAHLQELIEELLLITEAITASEDSKSDDEKDKKSALRMEAHAHDLSWNMMGESDGELLAKLSIRGPSFTWLNKADNSAANSLSIVDLSAVNVHPDAYFPEIISKWNKAPDHPMAKQGRIINAIWSELAPVGGISIVDQFELELHPLKVQMELKVGRMIMDYVFGSKRRREREEAKRKQKLEEQARPSMPKPKRGPLARLRASTAAKTLHIDAHSDAKQAPSIDTPEGKNAGSRDSGLTVRSTESDGTLSTTYNSTGSSASSTASRRNSTSSDKVGRVDQSTSNSGRTSHDGRATPDSRGSRPTSQRERDNDSDSDEGVDHSQHAIAKRNAEEMRQRASSNLTFVFFKLPETIFCLSYKGEKEKSITDIYDMVFTTPNIEYRNRTWAYEELVQHMKKDIIRAAWGQRSTIVKSILSHRPKRPEALRNIRDKQAWLRKTSRDSGGTFSPPYPSLQFNVHPPTPQGSRDVTPSEHPSFLDESDGDNEDDVESSTRATSVLANNHASPDPGPRRSDQGAESTEPSVLKLGRFLPSRLNRSHSPSLPGASVHSDVSHSGSGSTATLSGLRSKSPPGSRPQASEALTRQGSGAFHWRRSESPALVEVGDRTVRAKGSLGLFRQRSASGKDISSDSQLAPHQRPDASELTKTSNSSYSRMLGRRSRDELRDADDEQRPPAKDADAEEKAAALFGSSRSRD